MVRQPRVPASSGRSFPGRCGRPIESVCGAGVVQARTQPGGFSPGLAARVRCANGARYFVKAVSAQANPDTPRLHRQEGRVLAALEPVISSRQLPIPRPHGMVDHPPWVALVLQDVAGRQPQLPWQAAELQQVVAAVDQLAQALTPAPVPVPAVSERLGAEFTGWQTLATSAAGDRLDPWSRTHLDQLAALEDTWTGHVAGDTLLHADIRADNILITDHGAIVVDWPWACQGAAFIDLVLFAPQRHHARRPAADRPTRVVTVWPRRRPARRGGAGLRPCRLSHRTVAAAAAPRTADGARLPSRASHHRPPMARPTPLTVTQRSTRHDAASPSGTPSTTAGGRTGIMRNRNHEFLLNSRHSYSA